MNLIFIKNPFISHKKAHNVNAMPKKGQHIIRFMISYSLSIGNATNRINQNECNMIQHKKIVHFFSIIVLPTFLTVPYAWDQISHIKATELPNKWNEYIGLKFKKSLQKGKCMCVWLWLWSRGNKFIEKCQIALKYEFLPNFIEKLQKVTTPWLLSRENREQKWAEGMYTEPADTKRERKIPQHKEKPDCYSSAFIHSSFGIVNAFGVMRLLASLCQFEFLTLFVSLLYYSIDGCVCK